MKRPSFAAFTELVSKNPDIKHYKISPSLIKYMSKRTMEFAKERKIRIIPSDGHPGRPQKYDDQERQSIIDSDETPKEISNERGIPLRTVYFIRSGG